MAFQADADQRFAPSMRERIDLANIYERARRQVEPLRHGGKRALAPPATCPVSLDQLLAGSIVELEAAFSSAQDLPMER
jgi:hypothetical protein